ncbi:DNA ligase (ATP) [Salinarchaeum sp. Harcht-Bsk1]|uniref:ATP-dependent DNA ligase n=1 Tax=Salinarchaeum sp. Harcht-Bsk1 TaxID=1333523 RepID=UPI00034235A7|nr:DNA ligase (ATP) [Salinarchaeum sp. Harcht-Bsk1]AGM99989.1 DNA ligase (ATP) [Salinarchaeum sp. Harcht-Bsk1]
MEFEAFATRAAEIEQTDADLDVIALTADLLEAAEEDLPIVARFVQGRIFPAWQSRTHDIGPSRCYAALARAAEPGVSAETIEDRLADLGDVGDVAASLELGGQAGLDAFAVSGDDGEKGRLVSDVFEEFDAIASASGSGSEDRKEDLLFSLFSDSTPEEARYLSRLVLGEMRIGVGEGTVRDAIAAAFEVTESTVARALQVTNDYGLVAEEARAGGEAALDELGLEVGRPVQAMLAQAGTVTDALEDWKSALVETKLDGARVQVHYEAAEDPPDDLVATTDTDANDGKAREDRVHLYSRNMEEVTEALPEIVDFVAEHVEPPAILDGEVVAVDEDGEPLPFQEILRRFRRKHDVAAAREAVATELHVFDCLHAPRSVHDELGNDGIPTVDAGGSVPEADSGNGSDPDGAVAERSREQAGLGAWAETGGGKREDGTDPGSDGGGAVRGDDGQHESPQSSGVREPGDGPGVDLLDVPLAGRREYLEAVADDGVVEATVTADADEIASLEAEALEAGHEGIMLKNPEAAYTPGRRGKDWRKRKPDVETLDLVVTGAEWGEGRRAELLGTYTLAARTEDDFVEVGNVATGITDEELADLHDLLEPHVRSSEGQAVDIEPAVVFEVGYEEIQRSPTYESGYALRFPRFVTVREDLDSDGADSLERVERIADQQ